MTISLNDVRPGAFIAHAIGESIFIRHIKEINPVASSRRGRGDYVCVYNGYELPIGELYKWHEWCAARRMAAWADRVATSDEIKLVEAIIDKMYPRMKEEIARKAAKWWADLLRTSKFKPDNVIVPGMSPVIQQVELLYQEVASQESNITQELIDDFESKLADVIMEQTPMFNIKVDYHPDNVLTDAAERAGFEIVSTALPHKVSMWIYEDRVTVYRNEEEIQL